MSGSTRPAAPALAATLAAAFGCASFQPVKSDPVTLYALDVPFEEVPVPGPGPTISVVPPRAAAGFDGPQMVYVRRPHELKAFAKSQWVEPPARMVGALLARALEQTGRFQAVIEAPSGARAGLRLDSEVVRLQHEFTASPSQVRFGLRLQLLEPGGRVLGTREIEALEPAPSEDPYGGVVAANRAVRRVVLEAAAWCAAAVASPGASPDSGVDPKYGAERWARAGSANRPEVKPWHAPPP